MIERFKGSVLSNDTESKRLFVESNENSTAIIFNYTNVKDTRALESLDLNTHKYLVEIEFNGIMTMSLPGQASADAIEIIETTPLTTLSGTVSRYAHEGFYLKDEKGEEVRIKSQEFVELNDLVTITYDDTPVINALTLMKQ